MIAMTAATLLLACVAVVRVQEPATGAAAADDLGPGYTLPIVDLSTEVERQVIVDREPGQYLGHPTTVLLEDGRTLLAVYPKGHGRGAIVMKRSRDGGLTWSERLPVPENWAGSREVPTIHRVVDGEGTRRLILFSGLYPIRMAVSEDDGLTWTPLEPIGDYGGIVAMGHVEPLANGDVMALFHDDGRYLHGGGEPGGFEVYKVLSHDGGLTWSEPVVIARHPTAHLCEPGLIRSPDGTELAVLLRENSRRYNSFVIFSRDEGATWSEPRQLPGALTGDRHTGRYAPDGRLFITFRDTTRESSTSGDWVGWVGTYADLVAGREGQYRVRLMQNHERADCAYAGLELLQDGTFVTTTYGHWTAGEEPYIVSVRFRMEELDARLEGSRGPSADPVLAALGELESSRGAWSPTAANRLEDRVCGTPLTDPGRGSKVELQKELIRYLWTAATRRAAELGAERIDVAALAPGLEGVVRTEQGQENHLRVTLAGQEPVSISSQMALEYGSLGSSLRAVLAVQQDVLVEGAAALLPLDAAALERLAADIDLITLCALQGADADARAAGATGVDGADFLQAWRRLVPAAAGETESDSGATPSASRGQASELLQGLIRVKRAAYERLAGFHTDEAGESFFARHGFPPGEEDAGTLMAAYDQTLVRFCVQLLRAADVIAMRTEHDQIRSEDALRARQLLMPHLADDLGNVRVFPRLGAEAQVTLKAAECDALRDLGSHWGWLALGLERSDAPVRLPDPFAAEILAEGLSRYGVLLLRVAGQLAEARQPPSSLEARDLQRALRRIANRGQQDRDR